MLITRMTKGYSFSRRAPDNVTEELVAVLSQKASFEFKPLFDIIHANLRARNSASGGEEMLRLRAYEKLQNLVHGGMVKKVGKKYTGVASPLLVLSEQLKDWRTQAAARVQATAAAAKAA